MHIPEQMQSELLDKVEEFERTYAMPYISSFERRGLERGLKEGREEGREQGREEGQRLALSRLVGLQLTKRFGNLPQPIESRIRNASAAELQAWGEAVLDAKTLDDVFAAH
jgi:flagellar biosynthesis/type III secretory pathway protein FliH